MAVPETAEHKTIMIDATYLKAHRTALGLRVKKGACRLIGRTKGGMTEEMRDAGDFARALSNRDCLRMARDIKNSLYLY